MAAQVAQELSLQTSVATEAEEPLKGLKVSHGCGHKMTFKTPFSSEPVRRDLTWGLGALGSSSVRWLNC